jgi:hypothetical protein
MLARVFDLGYAAAAAAALAGRAILASPAGQSHQLVRAAK